MYHVGIYSPVVLEATQTETIESIIRRTLTDPKADIRHYYEPKFSITVHDDNGNERPGQQQVVTEQVCKALFQQDTFSAEAVRQAKIDTQIQILRIVEECAVTDDITETVFTVLTERMTGCMENLWKLCHKSWQEVCEELSKKGLEDFMERHLGEEWA